MKYRFGDINNEEIYKTTRVMFITGQYAIFNNIVSDRLKKICKGSLQITPEEEKLLNEFSMSNFDSNEVYNSIDFATFLEVVKTPAVTGRWFCSMEYKMLTKKQKEQLDRYMKKPSENGILVITLLEYQDYKPFLRNKAITTNQYTHLIQLSFPYRGILQSLVREMIEERGASVSDKALELFVLRMSNSYDDYGTVIDNICEGKKGAEMSYEDMKSALAGIENYVIDDFMEELLKPIKSKRIMTNRKIYKMLGALTSEYGAKALATKILYKVNDLIDMRIAINTGLVPVKIGFSVKEAKERLDEDNRLKKINDFSFKKYAYLSSRTSLRDWIYIKMILSNVKTVWNEAEYERVLHCVIHRGIMSPNRLLNDIGISNIIEEQLYDINTAFYNN